jgi:hypothetical protein
MVMGLLTDFFMATPSEIAEWDLGPPHLRFESTLQCVGVDSIKLEQLASLMGVPLELAPQRDEGERGLLFRLPQPLLDALVSVKDASLTELSDLWAKTEGWTQEQGTPVDVAEHLRGLRELASDARRARKNVYLWMYV